MDKKLRAALKALLLEAVDAADMLNEVHDTHVWADDDGHPKKGCSYCNGEKDLRAAIKGVKALLKKKRAA